MELANSRYTMSRPHNKKCIVPMCGNTSRDCPDKMFFYVPRDTDLKRLWLEAIQVKDNFHPTSNLYCCEDHFDLKEDTEENECWNYSYIRQEKKLAPILKIGVVPHIFKCQKNREDLKNTLNEKNGKVPRFLLKMCIIPTCGNTAIKYPKKRFFSVPRQYDARKHWLEAVQRLDLLPTHTLSFLYICEDHFDQPQDLKNYSRYKTTEEGKKIEKSLLSQVSQKFNNNTKKVSNEESLGCLTKNRLTETNLPSDPSTHNKCTTEGPGDPYREPSTDGASSVTINVDLQDYVRTLDSIVDGGGPTKVVKSGVRDLSGTYKKIFDEIPLNQRVPFSTELLARRYLQHVASPCATRNVRGEPSLAALAHSLGVADDRAFHSRMRDFRADLFRIIQRRVVSSMRRRVSPVEELRKVPPASFALALRLDLLRTGIQAVMVTQLVQEWAALCVLGALVAEARRRLARAGRVCAAALRSALAALLGGGARGLTAHLVGAVWLQACAVKKLQLAALTRAGDRVPAQEPRERLDKRPGALDWRLVDLMLLHQRARCCDLVMLNVEEALRALITLALVIRALGPLAPPPLRPAHAWARVRRAYLATDRTASVMLLQMRWLQLFTLAEERLQGAEAPATTASAPCSCDGDHASRHDLNHPLIQFIATDSAVGQTFAWSRVLRKDGVPLVTEEDIADLALEPIDNLVLDFTELEAIETVKGLKKYIHTKLLGHNENLDKYNDYSYSESDKVKISSEELSRMETESEATAKEIGDINLRMNNAEVPNFNTDGEETMDGNSPLKCKVTAEKEIGEINVMNNAEVSNPNTEEDESIDGSSNPLADVVVKQEREMLEISEERIILPDSVQTYRPYCEFDTAGDYIRSVIFDPSTNSSKEPQIRQNSFGHIETQRKGKTVIKREIIEQININKQNGDRTILRHDSSTESEDEFDHRQTVKRKLSEENSQRNGIKMYKTTKRLVYGKSKSRGGITKDMNVDDNVVIQQENLDNINITEYQHNSDSSTESEEEFGAVKTILKDPRLRPELNGLSETFLKNKRNQKLLKLCPPVVLRLRKCDQPKTGRKRKRLRLSKRRNTRKGKNKKVLSTQIAADPEEHTIMKFWPQNVNSCWCHHSTRPLKEEMDHLDSLMKQIVPKTHAVDTLINAAVLAHKEYWKEPADKKMVVTAGPGFKNMINIDEVETTSNTPNVVDMECAKATDKVKNDVPMTTLTEFTLKLSTNENEDLDEILACNIIAKPAKLQLTNGQTQPLLEKPNGLMLEAKMPVIKEVCSLADIIKNRNENNSTQASRSAHIEGGVCLANETRNNPEDSTSVSKPTSRNADLCYVTAPPPRIGAALCKIQASYPAVGRKDCSQPCSITDVKKIEGKGYSGSFSKPSQIDGKESYLADETKKCDVEDSTAFKTTKNYDDERILIVETKESGDKDSTSAFNPTQSNDDVCFVEDETKNSDDSTPVSNPTQEDYEDVCYLDEEALKSDDDSMPISNQDDGVCHIEGKTGKSNDISPSVSKPMQDDHETEKGDEEVVCFIEVETEKNGDEANNDDEYVYLIIDETKNGDDEYSTQVAECTKDDKYVYLIQDETEKSDGEESLPVSKLSKDEHWKFDKTVKGLDLNACPDDAVRFCLQVEKRKKSVDTLQLLDPTLVKPTKLLKESTNQPRASVKPSNLLKESMSQPRPVRLIVNPFQAQPRPGTGLSPTSKPAWARPRQPKLPWSLSTHRRTTLAQYAATAGTSVGLLRLDLSLPLYTVANYLIVTETFLPCKTASYCTLDQNLRFIEVSDDHVCGRECDLESKVYEERLKNNIIVNEDKESSEESSEIIDLTATGHVKLKVKSFADVSRIEERSPGVVRRFGRHFMRLPGGSSKYAVIYTVVSSTEQCDRLFRERAKMYVLPHSQGGLFPLNVLEIDPVTLFQQCRTQTAWPRTLLVYSPFRAKTPELAPDELTHPNLFNLSQFETVKYYANKTMDFVDLDMYSDTVFIIQHYDVLLIQDLTSKILKFKSSRPNNNQLYVVADYKVCRIVL